LYSYCVLYCIVQCTYKLELGLWDCHFQLPSLTLSHYGYEV
jgi:hypothetical protein